MSRWLLIVGGVLALAVVPPLAAPVGFKAEAAKAAKAKGKTCVGTRMNGRETKWQCGPGQQCCFDAVVGSGTCATNWCSFW